MKLTIRTRHIVVTPDTIAEIRHRLTQTFRRILPSLQAVAVTITDINGPKGGVDKQCRLRVSGRSLPSIVVEHVGTDTLATVALAAERAERGVLRKMARRRGFAPILAF
jgi:putative sigma-54 modulation protein